MYHPVPPPRPCTTTLYHYPVPLLCTTTLPCTTTLYHQVLILEPTRMYQPSFYQPSYVTVNLGAVEQSLQLHNLCLQQPKGACTQDHDWLFTAQTIKSIT